VSRPGCNWFAIVLVVTALVMTVTFLVLLFGPWPTAGAGQVIHLPSGGPS
jgi:hypothetical protein